MTLHLPPRKITKVKDLIESCINSTYVKAKFLAKVLGNVVACSLSHGPIARVCTRSGYCDLAVTEEQGWNITLSVSRYTVDELRFFLHALELMNGMPIQSNLTDVRVDTFFPSPISKKDFEAQPRHPINASMASDASNFKVACKWLEKDKNKVWTFTLSELEAGCSSGERELLAVLKCLRHFQMTNPTLVEGLNFIWATDSENLVSFINKGSPKWYLQRKIFEIYQLCKSLKCTLEPLHLLREDERIKQVDGLSKYRDTDNWSIDAKSFEDLHKEFGFDTDAFADSNNARIRRFISKNFEPGSYAVDAFSNPWPGMVWVCPPTSLLKRVAKRIRLSPCKGVVLVPVWPASEFYNDFFSAHGTVKDPFVLIRYISPYIFQNENATDTALFGVTLFKFAVLYFNTLNN